MRRRRNLTLWIVTLLFLVITVLGVALFRPLAGLLAGSFVIVLFSLLFIVKPRWAGLQPDAPASLPEVDFLDVFPIKLRFFSMNAERELSFLVDKQDFELGRGDHCDFVIPPEFRRVARRHALIHYKRGEDSFVLYLYPTKGKTCLNHRELLFQKEYVLKPGDIIELPGLCFKVESARF